MIYKSLEVIAVIESIIFLGLGFFFFFFIQGVSSKMGITFNSINGYVDYKAVYGGLHLGLGVFMFINLLRKNYRMVILAAFTITGGLAIARFVSIITDRAATVPMLVLMGIEIMGMVINGILLWSTRSLVARHD